MQGRPDQTLAVLTEDNERMEYAQAFLAAAQELGARAFQVNVPKKPVSGGLLQNVGKTSLAGNRPAIEA